MVIMAIEEEKTNQQKDNAEIPSEDELFANQGQQEYSAREVFAGDDGFYKSLVAQESQLANEQAESVGKKRSKSVISRRLTIVQSALIIAIALISFGLLYVLFEPPSTPSAKQAPALISKTKFVRQEPQAEQQNQSVENHVGDTVLLKQEQINKPEVKLKTSQAISLKVAHDFNEQKEYGKAYAVYYELLQNVDNEDELLRDFLQLKMALCVKERGEYEQAGRLFKMVCQSNFPAIQVLSNYHLCLLEMREKRYLSARSRAYKAMALIDAVELGGDWCSSLKRDCDFLAAEAVTRRILSYCDVDKYLPKRMWSDQSAQKEPFINMSENELRSLLNSGLKQLSEALLSPQIQKFIHQNSETFRYAVVCSGAPLEELMARFAANAGLELRWDSDNIKIDDRHRALFLCLPSVTAERFLTIAAGCCGLLSQMDENGCVNILNPAKYSSVSDNISLLSKQAISLWHAFLLKYYDDKMLPNAHLALGLLYAQTGQAAESMAECKLVANRFSKSFLAPYALLKSSKQKAALLDYLGARQDLMQLVEQYPDTKIIAEAYLNLADCTEKLGDKSEAARLYCKVFNLSTSFELQRASALGAGNCYYEVNNYEAAAKWLTQYMELVKELKSKDVYLSCFLLGKTNLALGRYEAAYDAFEYALAGGPTLLSRERYLECVSAVVEGYVQQGQVLRALDMFEVIASESLLSQEDSVEVLLMKTRLLRAIGLEDKAIAILGDRAEYITDEQLKAKILLELIDCYISKENLEDARRKLIQILVIADSGPLANEVALRLADVCLKLGHDSQTISVCEQLLELDPPVQAKRKALDLLAMAYSRREDYDKAAMALMGQWK